MAQVLRYATWTFWYESFTTIPPVIGAIESGQRVVLTVHGRPVADMAPRAERSERRTSDRLLEELSLISAPAPRLDADSPADDFDTGLTTDDIP